MNNSRNFWRALFFVVLLAALCGSFAFPITYVPANAAPRMQATSCVGTTIVQWTFEGVTMPSTGTGNFLTGPAFPAPTFASGNPAAGQAIVLSNWTTSGALDANYYVEFVVPTIGRNMIELSFDYRATGTGPQFLEIHYSTNGGTNFTLLGSNVSLTRDSKFHTLSFDFSSIAAIEDNANTRFRIYGYAGESTGILRLDNVTFSGNCLTPADTDTPTATATTTSTGTPTGTGTATGTATATNTGLPAATILINEVAWAGTSSQNSNDEWIELRNPGTTDINITGWRLYGDNNTLNQIATPNITLSGTIPAGGFFLLERVQEATTVTANQIDSSIDLLNNGERLYLKDAAGNTIDTANLDGGSWPAGTAAVTGTTPLSYASMERVGTTNAWVTYAGTVPIAFDRSGTNPIKGTPGGQNWIATATVTTITSDTPDPSLVNQNVTVSVTVVGGNTIPTGTVAITGANTNCTITLTNGSGSCTARFSSIGSKTLTATYSGDGAHPASNDTEPHTVSTTTTVRTPTPSRVPTLPPPPPLVAINEFVPRPGHDWNNDGEVNVEDEYIEIINHGTINVNLSGYSLDDEANVGSTPYSLPSVVLVPGDRIVFYGSETGLLLSDGGDGVRLLKPNGQLMDAYNYRVARYPDQSYCRLPDNGGLDDWNQDCYPTPGLQNSLSGEFAPPGSGVNEQLLCPIADTLPDAFVTAECAPYGNNIWRRAFWDETGWYNEKILPGIQTRWDVFAD